MKTKILSLIIIISMLSCISSCGLSSSPADLAGEWKQVNADSSDSWQAAIIEGETITIYWVSDEGDTKSLYWAGSYIAPKTKEEPYSWVSENDYNKTALALLASKSKSKNISYEDGQLSYEMGFLGTTTTIRLEKQK